MEAKKIALFNHSAKAVCIGSNTITPGKFDIFDASVTTIYPRVKELIESGELRVMSEDAAQESAAKFQELLKVPPEKIMLSDHPNKDMYIAGRRVQGFAARTPEQLPTL